MVVGARWTGRRTSRPARGKAIHRGSFASVKDLSAKIRAFIDGWNDRCHTCVWTKTAEEILKQANRQTTSNTGH